MEDKLGEADTAGAEKEAALQSWHAAALTRPWALAASPSLLGKRLAPWQHQRECAASSVASRDQCRIASGAIAWQV